MNEKQRDPRMNEILYPLYEEKRCTEIINDYELNEERKAKGKLLYFFDIVSLMDFTKAFLICFR